MKLNFDRYREWIVSVLDSHNFTLSIEVGEAAFKVVLEYYGRRIVRKILMEKVLLAKIDPFEQLVLEMATEIKSNIQGL